MALVHYSRTKRAESNNGASASIIDFFNASAIPGRVGTYGKTTLSLNWGKWDSEVSRKIEKSQSSSTLYGSRNFDQSELSRNKGQTKGAWSGTDLTKPRCVKGHDSKFLHSGGIYFNPNKAWGGFEFPLPRNEVFYEETDFKVPWNIFCPSSNEPKPQNWKPLKRNYWTQGSVQALSHPGMTGLCQCVSQCSETCLNRIEQTECNNTICPLGNTNCGNRAMQDLAKNNSPYAHGYEIFHVNKHKGYGLRATRRYMPGDLIVEYTGDVIDGDEIQRRIKRNYSGAQHYYFLGLERDLVIDSGLRGSRARFVNHSCDPNSVMQKWDVNGKPRMGLFALRQIECGTEFTYDYNFRWFAKARAQQCHCGAANCRGIIGEKGERSQVLTNTTKEKTDLKSAKVVVRPQKFDLKDVPKFQFKRQGENYSCFSSSYANNTLKKPAAASTLRPWHLEKKHHPVDRDFYTYSEREYPAIPFKETMDFRSSQAMVLADSYPNATVKCSGSNKPMRHSIAPWPTGPGRGVQKVRRRKHKMDVIRGVVWGSQDQAHVDKVHTNNDGPSAGPNAPAKVALPLPQKSALTSRLKDLALRLFA